MKRVGLAKNIGESEYFQPIEKIANDEYGFSTIVKPQLW